MKISWTEQTGNIGYPACQNPHQRFLLTFFKQFTKFNSVLYICISFQYVLFSRTFSNILSASTINQMNRDV